jgi:hypothetical protein
MAYRCPACDWYSYDDESPCILSHNDPQDCDDFEADALGERFGYDPDDDKACSGDTCTF